MRLRLDQKMATTPPTMITMAARIAYASSVGKPRIVLPDGLPSDWALTMRETVAVALRPKESVTVTRTMKLPVAIGVQVNADAFTEAQPGGSPVYPYVSGAVPPITVVVKVTLEPRAIVEAETVNALIVGPAEMAENVMAFDTSCPFTGIVPEGGFALYPVGEPTVYM